VACCAEPLIAAVLQLAVTIGILAAQLINYGTQHIKPYGWRIRCDSPLSHMQGHTLQSHIAAWCGCRAMLCQALTHPPHTSRSTSLHHHVPCNSCKQGAVQHGCSRAPSLLQGGLLPCHISPR